MADDPAYVRNFRSFTRDNNLTQGDLIAFEKEAYGANDRARVIMLSSVVENALEKLVRSKMRQDLNSDDDRALFDYSGPFGTFSGQTLIAFGCGWMGPNSKNDLDLIRLLRNGFAHCHKHFGLTTAQASAVCARLRTPDSPGAFIPHGYLAGVSDEDLAESSDKGHPRTRYIMTCYTLAERLLGAASPGEYNVPLPD